MTFALSLLFVFALISLLLITGIAPNRSAQSAFERKRRRQEGTNTKLDDLRERSFVDIESLRRIVLSLLFVCLAFVSIPVFGWGVGLFVTTLVALSYGPLARNVFILRFGQKIYDEQESRLLQFVQQHTGSFRWLRHRLPTKAWTAIDSKEELEHIIEGAQSILSESDISLLRGGLHFDAQQVKQIMTPKKDVFSIKKSEILGPLVLDELHKSGHSSFPVTNTAELNDVVGILRLRNVQTLDTSRRHTAKVETAMDASVHCINMNQSLTEALNLLLNSQQHMLVVQDDSKAVVGILTLDDIFISLFGQRR